MTSKIISMTGYPVLRIMNHELRIMNIRRNRGPAPSLKKLHKNFFGNSRKSKASFSAGFTMIELLVAMTLFIVVISLASGIFVQALRTQRAIIDLLTVNDNTSLTLEQIAREIRVSDNFLVQPQSDRLKFTHPINGSICYGLSGTSLARKTDAVNCDFSFDAGDIITSDSVRVEHLEFIVQDASDVQPRITILLGVGSMSPRLAGFVTNIQTTLSPREIKGL